MTISYAFQSQEAAERILGANDRNLSYIELLLGIELSLKGNIVQSTDTCSSLVPLFKRLEREAERKGSLSEAEILMAYEDVRNDFEGDIEPISILGKSVWPKSAKQREYMSSLRNDEVIFASGPAGTGQVLLGAAQAAPYQQSFAIHWMPYRGQSQRYRPDTDPSGADVHPRHRGAAQPGQGEPRQ